jgi:hypothetical protein
LRTQDLQPWSTRSVFKSQCQFLGRERLSMLQDMKVGQQKNKYDMSAVMVRAADLGRNARNMIGGVGIYPPLKTRA